MEKESSRSKIAPQLAALQTADLSALIRIGGQMLPRILNNFLPVLSEKQRAAIQQVMPEGGKKTIFIQLLHTPTPPIVVQLSQPPRLFTLTEAEVEEQHIPGLRLTVEDLQLLMDRKMFQIVWRNKSQTGSLISFYKIFSPVVHLGSTELKDMVAKAQIHFKPLLDLLPKPKR